MAQSTDVDHYEILQISPNADAEMIHRAYRLLAQRFHPDNQETGDAARFRAITAAYHVLSSPEQRAQYDVLHHQQRRDRWRLVASGARIHSTFDLQHAVRLTVLEILYTRRQTEPERPSMFPVELAELVGVPREPLEVTMWFLLQKGLVQRTDNSHLTITTSGAEYLEQNYEASCHQLRLTSSLGAA
jgi:curved DNA-binding protein CbpA